MERHEVWDVESTSAATDSKVELAEVKEELHVLEGQNLQIGVQ